MSIEKLYELEQMIRTNNKAETQLSDYFMVITGTAKGAKCPLSTIIKQIIDDHVLLQFNWDGVENKRPLAEMRIFSFVLFDVWSKVSDHSYTEYSDLFKKILKATHHRLHQKIYQFNVNQNRKFR